MRLLVFSLLSLIAAPVWASSTGTVSVPGRAPASAADSAALATAATGASVASIPGQFAVNPTGAATYSIPIQVPPGTAGMVPNLALNYSSKNRDGIVGWGWMLEGLPAVTHCARNAAQDAGVHGGVNYDSNDRFCFGGQRLVLVSGTYGANNSTYRTEIESFIQFVAHGTAGNGPSWFSMKLPSGTEIDLGATADSQILAVGKTTVAVWAANKILDVKGNYLTVTYTDDATNGQFYPTRIDYTGNGATLTPYNSVQFFYNTSRVDVTPQYQAGALVKTTVLLTDIKTFEGANLVYDYKLAYRAGTAVKHSRLTSVTLCDSGSTCLAPTTFGWQGDAGVAAFTQQISSGLPTPLLMALFGPATLGDFNADGLPDAISDTTPGCGPPPTYYPPYYFGSTGGTFTGTVDLGYFCPAAGMFSTALATDFDGNGRSDFVGYPTGGGGLQFYINQATGAGSQMYPISPGYPTSAFLGDFDGDGRTDYYEISSGTAGPLHISNGNGTFGSQAASIPSAVFVGDFDGNGCDDVVSWHLNGSGIQDGVIVTYRCNPAISSTTLIDSTLAATLLGATSPVLGDFNGDGKLDLPGYLSTGTGFVAMGTAPPAGVGATGDFDGDGRTDVAVDDTAAKQVNIWLSNGNGFTLATSLPYTSFSGFGSTEDWNGDGAADFVFQGSLYYTDYTPEEINTISNGLGATTTITYDRLNKAAVYTKGSGATYPTQDEDDGSVVVARVDQSNGIGGTYGLTYAYSGAKVDLSGRGFVGFSQVKVTDLQTNIILTNNYRTDFPYIGAVSSQSKTLGGVTLGFVTNTFSATSLGGTSYFVSLQHTVSNDISAGVTDLDGTSTWPAINVDFTYDSCGNVTQQVLSRSDGSSVTTNRTFTCDLTNHILGELTNTTINSILGASNLTRTESFTPQSGTGLLMQSVVEPSITASKLTTAFTRDSFGNVTLATQSGVDITTRSPVSMTYDSRGEFATTINNALVWGHTYAYSAAFGAVTSDTDPNGHITSQTYDTLGRQSLQTRPDNNKTQVTYLYCSGVNGGTTSCPTYGAYLIQVKPLASDGVTQNGPLQTIYYDSLSRPIANDTQGFTGSTIRVATQYNANGQVSQTSRPYFTSGGTPKWTVYAYDALGRLTRQTFPDTSDTTYAYHGLTTSVTNDKSQTQTAVRNAEGWVASVTDALSHVTNYVYNSFGELATVTDYAGNVISNTYDQRGNRTATSDPDLGSWSYTYDVLGELKSQTNARSQLTTLTYDKLQRPTQRVETDLTSNWTYDTATHGVGLLASASTTAGYNRAYTYDTLSRPLTTTLTVDSNNYTYTTTYNANGDPDTLTYPSGLALKYFYKSNRYLCKVSEVATTDTSCSGTNKEIWKPTTLDAELHLLTQSTGYGGVVVTTQAFDANTGAVQQIRAGTSDAVQNTSFSYDTIGNLINRSDTIQGWVENFCYDSLNRLTNSAFGANCTSTGTKTTAYDALGNITSKSDVGTYSYPAAHAARPHAVSSITGTVNGVTNPSFTYDNDGNMTAGAGRSFTWKSYDLAATITEGTVTLTLTYDSEHNRIKMASATDTTLYLNDPISGALEEKYTSGQTTTWRDYVRAGGGGIVAEYFNTGGTITKQFLIGDHLGSTTTLATTATAANERDSYDPWGKRRFPNGTDDPTGSITSMASRGFTGHEHLDAMGLINMNARLYDPQLGRFLSADTVVSNPLDGQSFNRYSYVENGPTNFTDPTGHYGFDGTDALGEVHLAVGGGPNLSGVPFTYDLEGAQATLTNSDGIQTTTPINTAADLAAAERALAQGTTTSSNGSGAYDCASPKFETVRVIADRRYDNQLTAVAFYGYTIHPAIANVAGVDGWLVLFSISDRTFQSISGKHAPTTNRPKGTTSVFAPHLVKDKSTFENLVLVPGLSKQPAEVSRYFAPGQYDVIANLGYVVGLDISGNATQYVDIRIQVADGVGMITGAFPISGPSWGGI